METVRTMKDSTIEGLKKLTEMNIDASEGFADAAKRVDDERLAELFRDCSSQRELQANELRGYTAMNKEEPEDSGTLKGTLHRYWLDTRAAINGGNPKVVLIEALRGEDAIKDCYEEVLVETAGSPVNDVLQRHYKQVKDTRNRIASLENRQ